MVSLAKNWQLELSKTFIITAVCNRRRNSNANNGNNNVNRSLFRFIVVVVYERMCVCVCEPLLACNIMCVHYLYG